LGENWYFEKVSMGYAGPNLQLKGRSCIKFFADISNGLVTIQKIWDKTIKWLSISNELNHILLTIL